MAGQFLKGALVSFMPTFVAAVPNIVVFQYNPESITHTWNSAPPAANAGQDPLAVQGVPGEQFSFTLSVDSNDMIAEGGANPVGAALATASGIYTRLAALEMLQYPSGAFASGLLGTVSSAITSAASALTGLSFAAQAVPQSDVPTVLFVWGPQRILPVRVTALTITEKLYDSLLNPTQADVQITLRVLTPQELAAVKGIMGTLANVAYVYSQGLRQAQALENLGDTTASIIGMLPNPL
ncbi:MAG: hypothetical protein ACLPV8_27265 [Steroidobacteraceae bacterium]